MHRHPSLGGLGVHHVKLKAQAGLIRTFLETASNPNFRPSLFHSILYRYNVLGEAELPNLGFPPFYSQNLLKCSYVGLSIFYLRQISELVNTYISQKFHWVD